MGVEDVDDLGKICERPGQSVDLTWLKTIRNLSLITGIF